MWNIDCLKVYHSVVYMALKIEYDIKKNKPVDIAKDYMSDKNQCSVYIVDIHLIWMIFTGTYAIFVISTKAYVSFLPLKSFIP